MSYSDTLYHVIILECLETSLHHTLYNKIFQHYIIRAKKVPLLYSDISDKFLEISVCVWLQTSQPSDALLDYIFRNMITYKA